MLRLRTDRRRRSAITTTATNALTARPRRRAPVWISIVDTGTAAVVLWFYALPRGVWFAVLYALLLVVSAVTVWALVSNRPRLAQLLLGATVLLALRPPPSGSPSWCSSPWPS